MIVLTLLKLGEVLEEYNEEAFGKEKTSFVIIANSKEAEKAVSMAGIVYYGDINVPNVEFCRVETQQECLAGALCVPKFNENFSGKHKVLFFVNRQNIVIVDDSDFTAEIISKIKQRNKRQGITREQFIYNYVSQILSHDIEVLNTYEKRLMEIEEDILSNVSCDFNVHISPIRRELLGLRGYYDELMDMCKDLEDDENDFFDEENLKFFGTVADRSDRLMGRTAQLLEYAQQVKDAYQSRIDAVQNRNMQVLTVISTIFYPLTLITGWYGMNFMNMPELQFGYPIVIVVSALILILSFVFVKKKNML